VLEKLFSRGPGRKGVHAHGAALTAALFSQAKKPRWAGLALSLPLIRGIMIMPLSGKEMLKLFERAGWSVLRQRGSHVRALKGKEHETIPMHKELAKGTESCLLKRKDEAV
jgi:predicted RNA binding protein YcfA (HicA-like mRNA interferase family)